MKKDIRHIVAYYKRKFQTDNPFEIADCLGILYQVGNIGCSGCYMFLKNHRYIFLDQDLSEQEMKLVMAHELGHAILHRKEKLLLYKESNITAKFKNEIEANVFAAELLISDNIIAEYKDCTTGQLARLLGYSEEFIKLKF